MKEVIEKKSKGKAVAGAVGLLMFALVLSIWPPHESEGQPVVVSVPMILPVDQLKDTAAALVVANRAKDSANIAAARKLIRLASRHPRPAPVRGRAAVAPAQVTTVVLPTDSGVVYEFPATQYGSVAIIQPDDYARVIAGDSVRYDDMHDIMQAGAEEAKEKIGAWAKILGFITKPFKKSAHDKE